MAGKNWDDYTDFELNCLVAESQGLKYETWNNQNVYVTPTHEGVNIQNVVSIYDPCNNPADAWPVIEDILRLGSINLDEEGVVFFPSDALISVIHVEGERLRASMICFLMLKESAQ